MTYTLAMGFSKASICSTLLRINKGTGHCKTTWTIWLIMIAVTASATGYFLIYVTRCGPIQGCRDSSETLFVLFFLWVSLYIVIDIMLAVVPLVIIRGLNMKKSLKLSLGVVLAMGGVTCLASILRIPAKLDNAVGSVDRGYRLGSIVLWSVVETGLGIIACCLPMIRKLLKSFDTDQASVTPGIPAYNQPGSSGHSRQVSHGNRHSLPPDSQLSPDQRTEGFVPLQLSDAVTASPITLTPGPHSTSSLNGQVQGHCPMQNTKSSGLDHGHQDVPVELA